MVGHTGGLSIERGAKLPHGLHQKNSNFQNVPVASVPTPVLYHQTFFWQTFHETLELPEMEIILACKELIKQVQNSENMEKQSHTEN